jgi:hypothetical protein
MKNKLSIITVF